MTSVVALRPNYEIATMYGYFWCGQLYVNKARALGYDVIDLAFNDCKQSALKMVVDECDPILISGVCHGNVDIIVGQNHAVLFKVGDEVTKEIVKGRHVWMMSCLAGAHLLKWMVEECKAVTTMGYKEEFIFCTSAYPNSVAKPFFVSHFTGVQEFLKGKTAGEAFQAIIDKFNEYLNDPNIDERIKPYLLHDMECAVLYGDKDARLKEEGGENMVKKAVIEVYMKEEHGVVEFHVYREKDKKPIQGAKITVESTEMPLSWEIYTDANGFAKIDPIDIGTYNYRIEKAGYEPVEGTIRPEDFKEVSE